MNRIVVPIAMALMACLAASCSKENETPKPSDTNAVSTGSKPVALDRQASKKLFDSWKSSVKPQKLIGNIHYVGLGGVSSFLITTPEGHILIDTTFESTFSQVCRNIEQLGFRVGDIKYILSSHAHADHTGAHAYMQKRSKGRVVASAKDAELLASGGTNDFTPFPIELMGYRPVTADQIVQDGDQVTLGNVVLTAHLTPGHTKGATTWTMLLKDGEQTYNVVFFSSTALVEPTRLVDNLKYPEIADDYRATFAKLKALPCDIFFAPHGNQFDLTNKLAKLEAGATPNPFIDPEGWKNLIATNEAMFIKQWDFESAGK